jgi:hypothetical protein
MKKIIERIALFLFILLFNSCNMEDFNLNKLSTSDIAPTFYVPMAYGTFKVKDYIPPIGSDYQVIIVPEVDLNTFNWHKGTLSFRTDAVDSAYMDVTFTNSTPMKMQIQFSFTDYTSEITKSKVFDSGIIIEGSVDATGKVVSSSVASEKFPLDNSDLQIIKTTDGIKCTVKFFQPGDPVMVKNLKESEFKIQLNLKANVLLDKLN